MTRPWDPLSASKLGPTVQMDGLGHDVDIDTFNTQMEKVGGIMLRSAITDAQIERTIEGASTLTVTCDDDAKRSIQRSGRLGKPTWVKLDGLWFALCGVSKSERSVSLKFEEREVNILRHYDRFIKADKRKFTRAEFALRMIQEPTELTIPWVIPELHDKQLISDIGRGDVLVDSTGKPLTSLATLDQINSAADQTVRQQGIPAAQSGLKVKGNPATPEQLNNANAILRAGLALHAGPKVMVCAIMTAIQENSLTGSVGVKAYDRASGKQYKYNVGTFQQDTRYWASTNDAGKDAGGVANRVTDSDGIEHGTQGFFQSCMENNQKYPNLSYADLCQAVQGSGAGASYYAPHQKEATAWVEAFGQAAGQPLATQSQADMNAANNMRSSDQYATGAQYYFRGSVSQYKDGSNNAYLMQKENSWDCLQRLAGDVNWRCFVVSGTIYFISEQWLFKSKPFMVINEDSLGIDWIDYDYDEGKKVATVTVTAHLGRWSAPPGSTVLIQGQGHIVDGKYLVNTVSRSLFDTVAEIQLKKPLPLIPEPTSGEGVPAGFMGTGNADKAANAAAAAAGAKYDGGASLVKPIPAPYLKSVGGYHLTGGLAGYPANDYFAAWDSPVIAVESGKIRRFSGYDPSTGWHDKPGEAFGWSIYLAGDTGTDYYYTHLQTRTCKEGDIVNVGDQIGTVAHMPPSDRAPHCHLGVHPDPSKNSPTQADIAVAATAQLSTSGATDKSTSTKKNK